MTSYESVHSAIAETESAKVSPADGVAGFFSAITQRIGCAAKQLRERWRARRAYRF